MYKVQRVKHKATREHVDDHNNDDYFDQINTSHQYSLKKRRQENNHCQVFVQIQIAQVYQREGGMLIIKMMLHFFENTNFTSSHNIKFYPIPITQFKQ